MNILFLSNLLPYPLDNGGKIKTYTTLKALKDAGHKVDLFCFRESAAHPVYDNGEKELGKICESIHQIQQKITTAENKQYMMCLAFKSLFSNYGLTTYKFISKEMVRCIMDLKEKQYDIIYFDHLPMYVYRNVCRKVWPEAKIILDEHNCEATILKRNARITSNPLKKVFMLFEAEKVERFETKAVCSSDKVIVLSKADYDTLRVAAKKDFNHSIIPIGVPDRGIKNQRDNVKAEINILFVGTLTWAPNDQGLIWLLENVIPQLDEKSIQYHLYIVGKNPSDEVKRKAERNQHITVTGYVESVDEYYDICDCMVVPLFIGSGQRVKIIEAFSKGMPVISTSIGAEGLGCTDGEELMLADTEDMFVKRIQQMENQETRDALSKKGRGLYERSFSPDAVRKMLLDAVQKEKGMW